MFNTTFALYPRCLVHDFHALLIAYFPFIAGLLCDLLMLVLHRVFFVFTPLDWVFLSNAFVLVFQMFYRWHSSGLDCVLDAPFKCWLWQCYVLASFMLYIGLYTHALTVF